MTVMNKLLYNKLLSLTLFICFILYQYGFNYHVSFGSLGLFITIILGYKYKTSIGINLSVLIPVLILTCFTFHLIKYGESAFFTRVLRYSFTAWALYFLLNSTRSILPPPEKLLLFIVCILLFVAWYQNYVDPFAKAPNELMALKTSYLDTDSFKEIIDSQLGNKLRASGLYTEPSVLSLVSSCLLILTLSYSTKLKVIITILILCTVVLSGSLLGYIGVLGFLFLNYKNEMFFNKKVLFVFVLAIPLGLFALTGLLEERAADSGQMIDSSTMARVVYPFVIIFENFRNFDLLGYCGDIYNHFLYLGIYDTPGNYPGHNGLLATVQAYGIFGVLMIFLLFKRLNSSIEYFIIFLIGSQSGNFFSYEKVFLMVYMVLVYRHQFHAKVQLIDNKLDDK